VLWLPFNLFCKWRFKIIQTFVTEKNNLLMVTLLFKWLFVFALPFQMSIAAPAPAKEAAAFHPFYVSVVEVNHNSKEKTLEVSCKIFADDMEDVIKQNYKTAIDLTNAQQHAQIDKLVNDYIVKHLAIAANGKPARLNYIGFEKEAESVYCYFEIPAIATVKKVDITNSILQDFNEKQINIMHVTVNGNRKSYKLDYPNKQASFVF
jgi:hypothetical protein